MGFKERFLEERESLLRNNEITEYGATVVAAYRIWNAMTWEGSASRVELARIESVLIQHFPEATKRENFLRRKNK